MSKGSLVPGYDPASIKLFSKCAKDHASRQLSQNSERKQFHPNKSSIITPQSCKREKKTLNMFDMSESRVQREKKFRKTDTPAVGQYKFKIEKDRPKLTWDILKVYKKRGSSVRRNTITDHVIQS